MTDRRKPECQNQGACPIVRIKVARISLNHFQGPRLLLLIVSDYEYYYYYWLPAFQRPLHFNTLNDEPWPL